MVVLLGLVGAWVLLHEPLSVGPWYGPASRIKDAVVVATASVAVVAYEVKRRQAAVALRRSNHLLELLHEVSLVTHGDVSDRSALHLALRAMCAKLGWSAGLVHLLDQHRDPLVSTSICEGDPAFIDRLASHTHETEAAACPVDLAMATRRPVSSEDDGSGCYGHADGLVGVAVPIVAGGEVVGALEFLIDTPRPFVLSSELRKTLATVGRQLGRVVERTRHHQDIVDRAAELAQVNDELRSARHREEQRRLAAERSNGAKSEFLTKMSHELRTPLNAIVGFTQLLQEDDLTPEQLDTMGVIAHSGRHVLELVNGLLDLSRIEAGHLDLALVDTSVHARVTEATSVLSPQAAVRRIEMVTAVPADLYVHADVRRLFQVLLNLLSNAVKYNRDAGTVTITAGATATDTVRLTVEDTGDGIAPEQLPRLFEPFDRLDASDVEGTGLGLALTKQLVRAMGGEISVDCRPGEGTRFHVDLPRGRPAAADGPAATDRSPSPAAPDGRRGPGPPS